MATRRRRTTTRDIRPETAKAVACVRQLINALGQSARAVEERSGITHAQLFVLQQLARDPALTINGLAARALTRQSTMSLLVARLEKARLVHRERSTEDGRRVHVTLTARGRTLVKRSPAPPITQLIRGLESMPEARVRELVQSLRTLLNAMEARGGAHTFVFESIRSSRL